MWCGCMEGHDTLMLISKLSYPLIYSQCTTNDFEYSQRFIRPRSKGEETAGERTTCSGLSQTLVCPHPLSLTLKNISTVDENAFSFDWAVWRRTRDSRLAVVRKSKCGPNSTRPSRSQNYNGKWIIIIKIIKIMIIVSKQTTKQPLSNNVWPGPDINCGDHSSWS